MNPLTNLDFWLNLGNLFAATAIALFAIKSGYIDKKCDDMERKHNDLCNKYNLICVVNNALNEKKFNVIKNASVEPRDYDEYEVQSWCYEEIFDHYHLWVPEVPLPKKIEDLTSDVPSEEIIFFP